LYFWRGLCSTDNFQVLNFGRWPLYTCDGKSHETFLTTSAIFQTSIRVFAELMGVQLKNIVLEGKAKCRRH
jgi:hypothetical protein